VVEDLKLLTVHQADTSHYLILEEEVEVEEIVVVLVLLLLDINTQK